MLILLLRFQRIYGGGEVRAHTTNLYFYVNRVEWGCAKTANSSWSKQSLRSGGH